LGIVSFRVVHPFVEMLQKIFGVIWTEAHLRVTEILQRTITYVEFEQ
jgi:hypothetical protein